MADISDINAAQSVKLIGSDATGVEQTPVQSTSGGAVHTNLRSATGTELLGQKLSSQSIPVVFPSDASIGTSSIVNDGSLWSVAADINAATSATDNPLLWLRNPIGSGKDIYIWRGRFGSAVTNTSMLIRIFINPTVTSNGSVINPVNRNVGGTNPATIALTNTIPTTTSNGTLLTTVVIGQNTLSADVNEDFAIRLRPGNSLLITGSPSSNSRAAAITLVWQEKV